MDEFQQVSTKALELPSESRAELAELLIQSLDETDDDEIKSAWLAEIRRRDEQMRAGTAVTKPAAQALQEARELLRCTK